MQVSWGRYFQPMYLTPYFYWLRTWGLSYWVLSTWRMSLWIGPFIMDVLLKCSRLCFCFFAPACCNVLCLSSSSLTQMGGLIWQNMTKSSTVHLWHNIKNYYGHKIYLLTNQKKSPHIFQRHWDTMLISPTSDSADISDGPHSRQA